MSMTLTLPSMGDLHAASTTPPTSRFFAAASNPQLAAETAKCLGTELGSVMIQDLQRW
jgi:hypothetical protein